MKGETTVLKTWKKAIVRTVGYMNKPEDVEAVVCGGLAIWKPAKGGRRVAHIKSGLSVASAFVNGNEAPSLAVLKARVEWALDRHAAAWEALESLPFCPSAGDMAPAHKAAIRAVNSDPPRLYRPA